MQLLEKTSSIIRSWFEKNQYLRPFLPIYEAMDTFFLTPGTETAAAPHVRDPIDLKRVMVMVVIALVPCTVFGIFNAGYQALTARGMEPELLPCMLWGARLGLPIIIVSYAVGGAWEVLFAMVRKHEINEGFLVTGLLFPLTLPPTTPLWQVAAGISFGVVIGKEVFGGTGMNILNPALTARAFVYFAYPGQLSGDRVWTAIPSDGSQLVDGFSGATALLVPQRVAEGQTLVEAMTAHGFSWWNQFIGLEPGSLGETSVICCLIGALILVVTGVGSWRTMLACLIGLVASSGAFWAFSSSTTNLAMQMSPWYHMVAGSFAFGAVFMATDPVSCPTTNPAKWVYGLMIGLLVVLIRVVNPAYPEGVMMAILFMNVFAPLLDHFVVQSNIKRRLKRYEL